MTGKGQRDMGPPAGRINVFSLAKRGSSPMVCGCNEIGT